MCKEILVYVTNVEDFAKRKAHEVFSADIVHHTTIIIKAWFWHATAAARALTKTPVNPWQYWTPLSITTQDYLCIRRPFSRLAECLSFPGVVLNASVQKTLRPSNCVYIKPAEIEWVEQTNIGKVVQPSLKVISYNDYFQQTTSFTCLQCCAAMQILICNLFSLLHNRTNVTDVETKTTVCAGKQLAMQLNMEPDTPTTTLCIYWETNYYAYPTCNRPNTTINTDYYSFTWPAELLFTIIVRINAAMVRWSAWKQKHTTQNNMASRWIQLIIYFLLTHPDKQDANGWLKARKQNLSKFSLNP